MISFRIILLLQSFLAGLAASGVLTSGLRLITKATFNNSKGGLRKGASKFNFSFSIVTQILLMMFHFNLSIEIYIIMTISLIHHAIYIVIAVLFFAISTFFELLCVLLYAFVFPKIPIVKYYRTKAASEGCKTVLPDLAASGIQTISKEVIFLFSVVIIFSFNCVTIFFIVYRSPLCDKNFSIILG